MSLAPSTLTPIFPAAPPILSAAIASASVPTEITSPDATTSEKLAAACHDGSLEAFEELVARFEARIYNFLFQKVGNAHDAQDLTQETFVRAWQSIRRFDPSRDFATWLFVIARRAAANHYRSRRVHDDLSEELATDDPAPSDTAVSSDESASLWKTARQLKPKYHEVLWLRYAEGFSTAETARVMGLTVLHVKVLLHRARLELAKRLKSKNL